MKVKSTIRQEVDIYCIESGQVFYYKGYYMMKTWLVGGAVDESDAVNCFYLNNGFPAYLKSGTLVQKVEGSFVEEVK